MSKIIEIEELSDEVFELEFSIELSMDNLESIEKNNFTEVNFYDNVWKLYDGERDNMFYLRFSRVKEELRGYSLKEVERLTVIMKCWVASLLVKYQYSTVSANFSYVLDELIKTEGFRIVFLEDFIERILSKGDRVKSCIATAIFNFYNYYNNFEGKEEYLKFLSTIPSVKPRTRIIPTVRDCLKFVWVLNDFFTKSNSDDWRYLYFYPVRIWWHLTSIIPIRIGEFLLLRRNCVYTEENRYYLKLPRIKHKGQKGKQIIDELEISVSVYLMIKEYIELTEDYGYSKTLLSYRAHKGILNEPELSRNSNILKSSIFYKILNDFYNKVITAPPYNFTVRSIGEDSEKEIRQGRSNGIKFDFERRLRPNDTRHIAFLSLMVQGFHPIEIARLGGHDTIYSQRHYQQHEFFLTDSGISKLIKMFSLASQPLKNSMFSTEKSYNTINIGKLFREKFIFSPAKTLKQEWDKLEIGYCTAPIKDCKTQCFRCFEYWRIEYDEFLEKREKIEDWMKESREEVLALYKTLFNLHFKLVSNTYKKINPNLTSELATNSKKLRDLLQSTDKFKEIYEGWL
ncbi:integrase [Bacillus thuringiensis]|uniref:integrase n=1 Tax=Bacillus thuringiensis TaxID=1428 RepID=UPI000BFA1FC5|nr:integrase [Bacillus thuringiensis]PEY63930.1 integrase [Bacillus thuringiensis]PFM17458.1 integrase [Bacillus thuringiensis]PFU02236.1 integrase [Bacillus thuringiensis]